MEPAALRRAYLEKMEEEGFSEAGGAGLGLLSMARKTGQPVTYRVEPLDDEKVCMMITVKL
jgi:hypothetical protein